MIAVLRHISGNLAPLTLAGAILAFLQPGLFLIFKDSFLWLFALAMFALGVVLEPDDMTRTLARPRSIVLGVLTATGYLRRRGTVVPATSPGSAD